MKKRLLLVYLLLFFKVFAVQAATYYVSKSGRDTNDGTARSKAWATIEKVNSIDLRPGDKVLFESGGTFEGEIYLRPVIKGTAANPITIGSYGGGRAIISSGNGRGFFAYNVAWVKLVSLVFVGSGRTVNQETGVLFYMDVANTKLENIVIDSVEVYGYRKTGISVGSWNGSSGYNDVSITNCSSHDNGDGGMIVYAEGLRGHTKVYVGHNKVFNNSGLPDVKTIHSGNGIILGGVDGGVIEYCEAYNNGWLSAWTKGGPVGIWAYCSNNIVIQYNESHHNRTGAGMDGGGFDLDGGCTNSIMQYNYSHDNGGAGFLVCQYAGAPPLNGVIVRYNISENDGRQNGYAGIHLWSSGSNGGIQNAEIYNNTVYMGPTSNGTTPKGIYIASGGIRTTNIRNNIIQTTGNIPLVSATSLSGIKFEGNNYWPTGRDFVIQVGSTVHRTLAAWQGTGQEMVRGLPVGHNLNPGLQGPGQGVTVSDPRLLGTLGGYRLSSTSDLIGKGLNLSIDYNLNPGKFDFYGNSLQQQGSFSIGAHQMTGSNNLLSTGGELAAAAGLLETYPNPTVDQLFLKIPEKSYPLTVRLYNMAGSLVLQRELEGDKVALDVSSLPRGVFLLQTESKKGVAYKKVVLAK